ncbi:MAG: hypothetical protein DCC63_14740 [Nitrospira sp.]|nr:MAG: hypothetical protein DCC63_14740 [Nitrospira sp.]
MLTAPVVARLASPPVIVSLLCVTSLIALATWGLGYGRWRGFVGTRFLQYYPPLWVAVACGIFVWIVLASWADDSHRWRQLLSDVEWITFQIPSMVRWLAAALFLFLFGVAPLLSTNPLWVAKPSQSGTKSNRQGIPTDFTELRAWIGSDEEVSEPALDRFGHDQIARRIALRLQQDSGAPTMAVIGPLGSGKSSIRRLVEHHLRGTPRIRMVSISLWPFESPEAAVRGILTSLVTELGRHVNILPLVGLSDEYVGIISETGSPLGGIAKSLRRQMDPAESLNRFSRIACATGLRFVLWVEDLERFTGGEQLDDDSRAEREVERLGPIRALLHLLDRCPHLSVIVSDTSLRTRFDIGKIVRFVEQLPELNPANAWDTIKLVRDSCLNGYPRSVTDPASPESRAAFEPSAETHEWADWLSRFRESKPKPAAAIFTVLKTPRALKSALRLAVETWEALCGEIDFDAVLVASVVRVVSPDLFSLINDHIILFQHGLTNPFAMGDQKNKPHQVVDQVKSLLGRESTRGAAALDSLLRFLFPSYPPNSADRDREALLRPQSLFVSSHADYWRRYLTQSLSPEDDQDQMILQSIQAWRGGEVSGVVDRLVDPMRSGSIESFVMQFQPTELCRLLQDLVKRLKSESAATWPDRSHGPGIVSVWRMMLRLRPAEQDVHSTVESVVQEMAPVHLPLAHDVACFFATTSQSVPNLISSKQQETIWRGLRDALALHFLSKGGEERLAAAIKDGSPWLLGWIAWGLKRLDIDDAKGLPFVKWPAFSQVLLGLAEEQPDVAIPQIVAFVTTGHLSDGGAVDEVGDRIPRSRWVTSFQEDNARRLFDFDRLIAILATWTVPDHLDPQMKAQCLAAVDAAKSLMMRRREKT